MTHTQLRQATEERLAVAGGLSLFVRSWHPDAKARGLVVIVPGFNSHSGYYGWVAEQFVAANLVVYALDLRGRGQSDGERFYVEKFTDYVADVSAVVRLAKSREPGLPTFLLGHSAGGVVACLYALDYPRELTGLISESFAHEIPAPDFALAVFKGLGHIAPHAHILHLKNEIFTRDPKAVETMNADALIAHVTLPVLILHGTADQATRPSGSQHFYDRVGSHDKTLKLYDGHFHDLLNDVDKEIVISEIKSWIVGHLRD